MPTKTTHLCAVNEEQVSLPQVAQADRPQMQDMPAECLSCHEEMMPLSELPAPKKERMDIFS
jgi:hypothetical protein